MEIIYNIIVHAAAICFVLTLFALRRYTKLAQEQNGIPNEWNIATSKLFGLSTDPWNSQTSLYMQQVIRLVKDTEEIVRDQEGNTINLKGLIQEDELGFGIEISVFNEDEMIEDLNALRNSKHTTMH